MTILNTTPESLLNKAAENTMSVSEMFKAFLDNLSISNTSTISLRYGELTTALNKKFRDTESKTDNTLRVGSFGRITGIDGISDLDMLYIMPKSKWDAYKDSKQLRLLQDTKAAILERYPTTKIRVDRLVVTVTFTNFHVEVQPVFEDEDGNFKYPDTKSNNWKVTMPRLEMKAVTEMDDEKNGNLRPLCKMARAWKNKHGVAIGGLLIDTLVYNFLNATNEYDDKSYSYFDWMCRDFFKYLSELPEQDYYAAPGSGQRVRVKKQFQKKAKKAHKLSLEAIEAEGNKGANDKWKKVFGRPFPANQTSAMESQITKAAATWRDTEEFIEDKYPVDIRYTLQIDCEVKQNGFRDHLLRTMLLNKIPLLGNKELRFQVTHCTVPGDYEIKWKVLNRGEVAKRRDCIRGQIWADGGRKERVEQTQFRGDHIVECYAVQDGVVIAKDRIRVPIATIN